MIKHLRDRRVSYRVKSFGWTYSEHPTLTLAVSAAKSMPKAAQPSVAYTVIEAGGEETEVIVWPESQGE